MVMTNRYDVYTKYIRTFLQVLSLHFYNNEWNGV